MVEETEIIRVIFERVGEVDSLEEGPGQCGERVVDQKHKDSYNWPSKMRASIPAHHFTFPMMYLFVSFYIAWEHVQIDRHEVKEKYSCKKSSHQV